MSCGCHPVHMYERAVVQVLYLTEFARCSSARATPYRSYPVHMCVRAVIYSYTVLACVRAVIYSYTAVVDPDSYTVVVRGVADLYP